MRLMWAVQEIMSFVKKDDHIAEHIEASKALGTDIETGRTHEEHTAFHLEYRLLKGLLSEEHKQRYLEYKSSKR